MQVGNQQTPQAFTTQLQRVVSDGRIDRGEFKELKQMVARLNVPDSEKQAFLKLAEKIKDSTNFSLFSSDGVLDKGEMAELQTLAGELKDSRLAGELFEQFSSFAEPVEDSSFFGRIGNFLSSLFSGSSPSSSAAYETDSRVGMFDQAQFDPNEGLSMPDLSSYAPTTDPSTPAQTAIGGTAPVGLPAPVAGSTGAYTSQWGDVQLAQAGQIPGNAAIHRRESQANCGVASASMILKQLGINPPDMHQIRERIDARTSRNGAEGGAFAISTDQLENAVKLYAGDQGKAVAADTQTLPANAGKALETIAARLAQGEKVVLLTGGFGGTVGHYTVIKAVNPDGSFIVDDPARGPNMRVTADQLQRAMDVRAASRGPSEIISFKG